LEGGERGGSQEEREAATAVEERGGRGERERERGGREEREREAAGRRSERETPHRQV